MKKKLHSLLSFSFLMTTLGLVMDGDPVEPSMLLRFTEFFAMLLLVFALTSFLYFTSTFIFKKNSADLNFQIILILLQNYP